MKTFIDRFESGWLGLSFSLGTDEIDKLIGRLNDLKAGKVDHFHFRGDFDAETPGIGDVEISRKGPDDVDDLEIN